MAALQDHPNIDPRSVLDEAIAREAGKRLTHYASFKSSKRGAQVKLALARLIAAIDEGSYVEPSKIAVGDFVRDRIDQWEAAPDGITARTAQRYRQLAENQNRAASRRQETAEAYPARYRGLA